MADSDHCANLCLLCCSCIRSCHGRHVPEEAAMVAALLSVLSAYKTACIYVFSIGRCWAIVFLVLVQGVGVGTLIYAWYTRQRGKLPYYAFNNLLHFIYLSLV